MTATTKTAKTGVARRADKPKASDAVKRENRTGWAFMAPFGILFALVFILPIIWAIYSSFFRQVTTGGGAYGGGELVDKFVGLQNFQYVITSGNFWAGVGRVVLYTVIQVPVMIDQHVVAGEGPGRDVGHRAEDHIVAEEVHLDADGGKSLNDRGNLAVVEVHPDDGCDHARNGVRQEVAQTECGDVLDDIGIDEHCQSKCRDDRSDVRAGPR